MSAKIATAPISWGVSEVPGWGVQLPPERVLAEMRELGHTATEIGADGFLPEAPADKAAKLREYDLEAIGSFVPVVLHQDDVDPLPRIERELEAYAAAGGDTLVVCAVTGLVGYDVTREPLTDAEWATLFRNLDTITKIAAARGVRAALHPHVGSVVETEDDVNRVLEGSTIPFCFDTGHLMIGGTDPVAFAAAHADRIAHTHLKDVSLEWIRKVKAGEISYYDACIEGLYTPLGQGDVDVRAIVTSLVAAGYSGWLVLEQDKIVQEDPAPGEGPIEDARASVTYLRELLAEIGDA